jgi:DNA-directed RNA polymerase I, II, and III subunit RPABC3
MQLILDVNVELYPVKTQDKLTVVIARSLATEGSGITENEGHFDAGRDLEKSIAKEYDYVMYGKVYKFDENKTSGQM